MRQRRLPIGAEPAAEGGAHLRVWAPHARTVEVVIALGDAVPVTPEGNGYFSGEVTAAGPGTRYHYRLDGCSRLADPASRFQPEGVHGPSEVIDPSAFRWSDAGWPGVPAAGHVVYEMHVGTFTREGTWPAAMRE